MTHNQINYWNLQELKRHNVVTEGETNRHNVATEGIDIGKLNEQIRSNTMNYAIEGAKLGETNRANLAKEAENAKHNRETERQGNISLSLDKDYKQELARHNQATEGLTGVDLNIKRDTLTETGRHNVASEEINRTGTEARAQLDRANAELSTIKQMWEGFLSSSQVDLNNAQRQELQSRINKYSADIGLIESNIKRNNVQNINDTLNTLMRGLNSLYKTVDALQSAQG